MPSPTQSTEVPDPAGAYTSLCHELARLLGPVKPRMGTTTNEQLIAKVGQVLIERDEAAVMGLEDVTCPTCGALIDSLASSKEVEG